MSIRLRRDRLVDLLGQWFQSLSNHLTQINGKVDRIMAQIDDLTTLVSQVATNNDAIVTDLQALEAQAPPNLQPIIDSLKATAQKQSTALASFPSASPTPAPTDGSTTPAAS